MKKNSSLMRDESGAITAMTVIMLAAFVGLMALVVDLGHLHIVQNELWNAADACALRGARAFMPRRHPAGGVPWTHPGRHGRPRLTVDKAIRRDNTALDQAVPTTEMQVGILGIDSDTNRVWDWKPGGNWVGVAPSWT